MYSRTLLNIFAGIFLLVSLCSFNNSIAQEQEREKTTFYISPSAGFIPHGINSMEGMSIGMIKPISEKWEGYLEMMGLTTFSTDIEDAFEFDDWHQSTYWGIELGGLRYFSLERFNSDRLLQWSVGLMYRSGSEELILDQEGGVNNSSAQRTRSYLGEDFVLFTKRKRLNDLGLSMGSAYEISMWEGLDSFAGGRLYLSPSGEHFFRFTFQVFYDL